MGCFVCLCRNFLFGWKRRASVSRFISCLIVSAVWFHAHVGAFRWAAIFRSQTLLPYFRYLPRFQNTQKAIVVSNMTRGTLTCLHSCWNTDWILGIVFFRFVRLPLPFDMSVFSKVWICGIDFELFTLPQVPSLPTLLRTKRNPCGEGWGIPSFRHARARTTKALVVKLFPPQTQSQSLFTLLW